MRQATGGERRELNSDVYMYAAESLVQMPETSCRTNTLSAQVTHAIVTAFELIVFDAALPS